MNAMPPDRTDIRADAVAAYVARTPGSKALAEIARPVLADKTPIAMPFAPEFKEAYYPIVSDRSEGAYLWDVDGNRYVDILMGLGTNLWGHNPAPIRSALLDRLDRGIQIGPQTEIAAEAAAIFAELTGHQRVTFSTTGTEANMAAIRLARAATGRSRIAVFTGAYHGHADGALFKAQRLEYVRRGALQRGGAVQLLHPLLRRMMLTGAVAGHAGIPAAIGRDVIVLDYGNPRSLDIIRRQGKRLAAVLVEPVQSRAPELQPREFLQDLRQITEASGTALIFDEMISGFRVAPGGAQEYFGVQADLATYGKIAGGGLPLSLIAGSRRFMDRIDGGAWHFGDGSAPQVPTTMFAGTHCRHPLSMTAALAAAQMLRDQGPALQQGLNARTAALVARLNAAMVGDGIALRFTHFGSFFAVNASATRWHPQGATILSLMALAQGLHMRPGDKGGFLSTAHGAEDLEFIFQTLACSLRRIAAAGLIAKGGAA